MCPETMQNHSTKVVEGDTFMTGKCAMRNESVIPDCNMTEMYDRQRCSEKCESLIPHFKHSKTVRSG